MKRPAIPLAVLLPATTVLSAVVAGVLVGIEVSLLVIAGGALVGVIALFWASVQSLTGESPITLEEALSLGAPSAEEEQKRAVLRALKDLEFERSVGKITQEDYVELSNRYRAEARRLMHLLDSSGEKDRAAVEQLLAERLATAETKASKAQAPSNGTDQDEPARSEPEASALETESSAPDAPKKESAVESAAEAKVEPKATVKTAEGESA
jgi:hypothetical protein